MPTVLCAIPTPRRKGGGMEGGEERKAEVKSVIFSIFTPIHPVFMSKKPILTKLNK
jgi:hypothetical protein